MLGVETTMHLTFKSKLLYIVYLTTALSAESLSLPKLLGTVFSLLTSNFLRKTLNLRNQFFSQFIIYQSLMLLLHQLLLRKQI